MSASIAERLARLDWAAIGASLDERGYARTQVLLTAAECADLRALYAEDGRFRSRVDMARYRFGVGEYKYFANPLPGAVQELREHAYPPLARPVVCPAPQPTPTDQVDLHLCRVCRRA